MKKCYRFVYNTDNICIALWVNSKALCVKYNMITSYLFYIK